MPASDRPKTAPGDEYVELNTMYISGGDLPQSAIGYEITPSEDNPHKVVMDLAFRTLITDEEELLVTKDRIVQARVAMHPKIIKLVETSLVGAIFVAFQGDEAGIVWQDDARWFAYKTLVHMEGVDKTAPFPEADFTKTIADTVEVISLLRAMVFASATINANQAQLLPDDPTKATLAMFMVSKLNIQYTWPEKSRAIVTNDPLDIIRYDTASYVIITATNEDSGHVGSLRAAVSDQLLENIKQLVSPRAVFGINWRKFKQSTREMPPAQIIKMLLVGEAKRLIDLKGKDYVQATMQHIREIIVRSMTGYRGTTSYKNTDHVLDPVWFAQAIMSHELTINFNPKTTN